MESEEVFDVVVHRHVFTSNRPFSAVLDAIFGGISQPDIERLFSELAASTSYEEFTSLVQQAQGSAGLMRFLQLDLDNAFTHDPQAAGQAGRRLVRLIAGNAGRENPSRLRQRRQCDRPLRRRGRVPGRRTA